jgi:hypothetical protein
MLSYNTWLETTSNIPKVLLVQINYKQAGNPQTLYLSTHTVNIAGQQYFGIIRNNFTINQSISTEYTASISYSDIEIFNGNGEYDSYLSETYVWNNQSAKVYIGPLQETYTSINTNFELIFDGLILDIDSKDRNCINFKLVDKLQNLNTSLSELTLGNYYQGNIVAENIYNNQYKNNLKPICFGEVHNITPLFTDPTTLEYMVHHTAVEQILEVRDNGVPVAFNTTIQVSSIPQGSFRLIANPVGTITCSIQGSKAGVDLISGASTNSYFNTASSTIASILKNYGKLVGYSSSVVDTASFSSQGSELVGVYIPDRVNVLQLCQDIAKHTGRILTVSRLGKLKLIDLAIPTSTSNFITNSDILLNSLSLIKQISIVAGHRIGYAKNWTIQNNLETAIPQQHKELFSTEYLEYLAADTTAKNNYNITTEPEIEGTYLIDIANATSIATKKLNLFKQPRKIYKMTCISKFLYLEVGDSVQLQLSRFGLMNKYALIVTTVPDWIKGTIELEVLV